MSDIATALGGARSQGSSSVSEAPMQGMITLRGNLADPALVAAVTGLTGADMPSTRQITQGKGGSLGWMSPDELLILVPHQGVTDAVRDLSAALKDQHALVCNVSDARAVFTLSGPTAREVLAKLCPVDLAPGQFETGELRRTRVAQVAAAFWVDAQGDFTLICFRSVAQYVFNLLTEAALPGGEVGVFA